MTTVFWLDKIKTVEDIDTVKVDQYTRFVKSCLNGNVPICWRKVHKIPLHKGQGIREEIKDLKAERIHYLTVSGRASIISDKLKVLRTRERDAYQFDTVTRDRLKRNCDKLKDRLRWLAEMGEVESWYVDGHGKIKVEWWTIHETIEVDEIEQGWTYKVFRDEADKDTNILAKEKAVPILPVADMYSPPRDHYGYATKKILGARDLKPIQDALDAKREVFEGNMNPNNVKDRQPTVGKKAYLPRPLKVDKTNPYDAIGKYRPYNSGAIKFKDDCDDKTNW